LNERLSSNRPVSLINSVKIQNIISLDRIIFLDYPSKRDALIKLAENLSTAPQIKNKEELISEIIRREELMSTAIGKGIAIPHVRLNSVTDLVVSIGISRCDIVDFQTLDDVPVRLLFMIAAAFNQHAYYLQTLSFFSARLKVVELRDGLRNCKTTQEAYDLLIQQDR